MKRFTLSPCGRATRAAVVTMLILLVLTLLALPTAAASDYVPTSHRVYDPAGLFDPAEQATLAEHLNTLSDTSGAQLYLATYRASGWSDDFIGDEYCATVRRLDRENAVLLIITFDTRDGLYYYDMYTYGRADSAISSKEVDYILDRDEVYDNLKGGRLLDGATAFFDLSVKAYEGRVGVSYAVIIPVAAVLGVLIGVLVAWGVASSYSRRHPTVDYPLDRYARLELTAESDTFAGKAITRTYVPRSNGGGGGGGSRHGGGGGHRGGR